MRFLCTPTLSISSPAPQLITSQQCVGSSSPFLGCWASSKLKFTVLKWFPLLIPSASVHAISCVSSCSEQRRRIGPSGWKFQIEGRNFFQDCQTLADDVQKERNLDVITFGNLCVDIVLKVAALPPPSYNEKLAYMEELASSSPDKKFWEAGGNSNFAIAAARLGLNCAALGHVGHEQYGSFLKEVLEKEGVQVISFEKENLMEETPVCWVLVDPCHCHGFCSWFDFKEEPAFKSIKELPANAKEVIRQSKVLFCNGFLFDELSPQVIISAVNFANEVGCVVFFDPGPRGKSIFNGFPDQQLAFNKLLNFSDVLLLTAEEGEALTGIPDPVLSAKTLLNNGQNTKWVIVKMGEKGCLMVTTHGIYQVPAFKVDIKDTVGCGDSFAAAIALGYTRGLPVTSTLALANAVGAATAMGCGAGRNVASMDDVMKILLTSPVYDESNGEEGTVHRFSMEESKNIGMQELFHRDSTGRQSAWSMPFNAVTRETADFLNHRKDKS